MAWAQETRPRVVVVFDTSGSMGVDVQTGNPTGGDNSAEYPGDGNLSRLFVAKNAIATQVQTTSEVEFALMRYPQVEALGVNRGPLDGRQNNTYVGLAERPLNYTGECLGQLRDPDAETASSLLVPFGDANAQAVLAWMDHHEDYPGDPELRADGPTPIAETLRLAARYLQPIVAADALADCRPYAVVLLTDGGESCVPVGVREAELVNQANALQALGVRTYVVAFAVGQRDIGLLAALARAGGTAINARGDLDLLRGVPYQAQDAAGLRRAFNQVLQDAIPVELCNDADDDCDGRIDEGVRNACGACGPAPQERCDGLDQDCDDRVDEGALNACGQCGPLPAEICNGADDDCDGVVDEAVANACGGCAGVREEVCNNLDDDCDGRVDNVPGEDGPLTRVCSRDLGACREGRERCLAGVWRDCDGVEPAAEDCNGVDDDCDGAADEDEPPCGPAEAIGDIGECRVGRRRCDPAACEAPGACAEDGWLAACEEARGPEDEICDGRDNDCDGEADEGLFNACGRCGPTPPESCNGADDNCDGRVDEDAACPMGFLCFAGECVQRCDSSGECNGDFACRTVYPGGDFCHPDPCAGVTCGPGERCDGELARCVDPCADADCEGGCDLGACVPATCRHTGCPDGEICRGDACGPDPCAGVECAEGAFCREGECVPACRDVRCGEGMRCHDGVCVEDPCGGRCVRGQVCDASDGACVADPCAGQACPVGMACEDGTCRADAACVAIRCPAGTTCVAGACTDFTPGVPPVGGRPEPRLDAGAVDAAPRLDAGAVDATPPSVAPDAARPAPTTGGDEGCRQVDGAPSWLGLLLLGLWRRRCRGA